MRPTTRSGSMLLLLSATAVASCGGGSSSAPPAAAPGSSASLDMPHILIEHTTSRIPSLQRPSASVDALEDEMRAARGDGRTQAMRKLALGHMWAAEAGGSPRDVRRHRHDADEQARDVVERSDDRAVQAEMSFVQIWDAWRGERPNASRLAERFVARHSDAGELVPVVWIIRGEIALEAEQYQEAEAAYRFLLGELEHPFYPLALYRTAACYRGMHRADDAKQALREVDQIGRRRNATPLAKKLGEAARRELGLPPPEQQAKKD